MERPADVRSASAWVGDRVLGSSTGFRVTYHVLGLIALLGIGTFWWIWLTLPDRWRFPALYVLATLAVAYYVAVWVARWVSLRNMRIPRRVRPEPGLKVGVATSFVPGLEPLDMLELTVRKLLAMDYPHDTWVLDEGDDPAVRALCARLGARHFSRRNEPRYHGPSGKFASRSKHGNYNAWLDAVAYREYDYVVTFDPDHVPEPQFLTCTLGYFRDPSVAYVQAPQVYYNQEASFIARGAAEETYAYYSSHLMASYGLGHTVIIGSHSTHRVAALEAAGGFPAHDAEDLYLTMLYRAKGWVGVYVPEILAMGTTPVDWAGYLTQQIRWARSVLNLKRHVLPRLVKRLSRVERVLNLFHGIYYLRPLILLGWYILLIGMLVQNAVPAFLQLQPLLALAGLVVLLSVIDSFRQQFYLDPERERGFHWRAALLQIAKAPHLAVALLDVLLDRQVGYVTTRKSGRGAPRPVLAPPHLALAAVIVGALGFGFLLHGTVAPVLVVIAAIVAATSLGLAATEPWRYPPPFDPAAYDRRRALMAERLNRDEPAWDTPLTDVSPQTAR